MIAPPAPDRFAARLLEWMAASRRDLPWRRNRTPYGVWISEVMLQQTQAATVIPYFERWLAHFPDAASLAAAPLDRVLKAWEGLGYYARARNLHQTAKLIVQRRGGQLPNERAELLSLPGIGRYTVGAILSIAFGQAEPILDGNVRRVLSRVYDISDSPRAPATESRLWDLSTGLVRAAPTGEYGELNEALMELGALVCTPGAPDCPTCPVREICLALERGTTAERPVRTSKKATPHFDVVAAIIADDDGRILIIRRPPAGLLGGLWGFPGGIAQTAEGLDAAVSRTVLRQTGLTTAPQHLLTQVKHAYTHFRITLYAFTARIESGQAQAITCDEVRWVEPAELDQFAFPSTDRKVARQLVHAGSWDVHVGRHV